MFYFFSGSALILVILIIFFLVGKNFKFDTLSTSVFECGFTSYYLSRFSFSMHYFSIALIFLFLDLELCYVMPFFNLSFSEIKILSLMWIFILVLVLGLMEEWKYGLLDWKF